MVIASNALVPSQTVLPQGPGKSDSLLESLRIGLQNFEPRERDIVTRRLGIGQKAETLQIIATDYGMTRERVRQIEKNVVQKFLRPLGEDRDLTQRLKRLMVPSRSPLTLQEAVNRDSWFKDMESNPQLFGNLVRLTCRKKIHVLCINHRHYLSRISIGTWKTVSGEASALLKKKGCSERWPEAYARAAVRQLLPREGKEFAQLLWDHASRQCNFAIASDGTRVLAAYGWGAEAWVRVLLLESNVPLHYTELAKGASRRARRALDIRRVHGAAQNEGLLLGCGIYGLRHHIPFSDNYLASICAYAEGIVNSGMPGKQWHASEILDELKRQRPDECQHLDKYVLNYALSQSQILESLKRLVWVVKSNATPSQRVDLRHAVIRIVKQEGRPMTTREIKGRLQRFRGVNSTFSVIPMGPLVRIKPGVWGIQGRDV